ncbi:alpha-xylosidase [Sediminibacillus halophilus]|uniref:alpha-D-xyloside xylohydrolase n=1 Tax=Sediminibacillus halophilus TaxID=482461 RepID=A0A1G9W916_9BACI|nr:alpha-xylosidase [Sediminibacillus halophilus]SDM81022.1 alpha-D-xyloside xylohydrolase [Sediminibacillus halophilus]
MKFTNGFWLTREGYDIHFPRIVRDVKIEDNTVTLFAPCKEINHRGDTLNIPSLTIQLTAPVENVIRVKAWHHKGEVHRGPDFNVVPEEVSLKTGMTREEVLVSNGSLQVRIQRNPFHIQFLHGETPLTHMEANGISWIQGPEKESYMRAQLNLGVGESLYGLGERFTPFVKNGQVVETWNKDGGTSSEQSYKNVPFYLSSRGYGVFVNHPENVSFELGSEAVSKTQFSVEGELLDYYVIDGPTPKEALGRYTELTGKPELPPAWSFGLWLTTSFTTDYNEETVNHFVDGMAERNIPLSVFHFDCFWMKEFEWCNFEWDRDCFPEPEAMLQRLKAKGLKICVWINPYIAEKSPLFDEAAANGYLLKKENGDVWQWDLWQAGMGIVDFTNPDACQWYAGKLKSLLDMGVDTFKTDFGERIPTDVVYFDDSDPKRMHNYYAYKFNKVVFDLLKQERGEGEAVVFARAATAGGQQFPVHWGGDCDATYESMAESLRGGLSLTLSGFGYWSHDIGGFENTATPDLFKRWTAFGLLSSHSRLHGSKSYRVPWLFDEEAVEVTRHFSQIKNSLMPYLFAKAVENQQTGVPVMRPMILEFPEDRNSHVLDQQYMLGDSLLVAPIFNEEGIASYYLPHGKWTHLLTNEVVEGGSWHQGHYNYMSLPLFVKENTILPVGKVKDRPDYNYTEEVSFVIYQLNDGQEANTVITDSTGNRKGKVEAVRDGNQITISTDMEQLSYSIVLKGITSIVSASAGEWEKQADGVCLNLQDSKEVVLTL